MKYKVSNIILPIAFLLAVGALWEFSVRYWKIPPYLLPGPVRVLKALEDKWDLLSGHCLVTTLEIVLGFVLAMIGGLLLAVLIHVSKIAERTLLPIVIASQTVPVFAVAPLLILWFGYGIGSKVVMSAIIVFFPIVVSTIKGLNSADPDVLSLFQILEASKVQIFMKVRVPAAAPHVFSGLKIGAAVSVIGAVIGEWVGAKEGLGYLMVLSNAQLKVDLVFASIFMLSVVGVLFYALVALIERLVVRW